MKINVQQITVENKEVEVDIDPNIYVFIVKYTRYDGSQYVSKVISSSLKVYFYRPNEVKNIELVKWFIYTLNAEKESWEFDQNFDGNGI